MREILFRGKRVDNGEWVEGIPIKTYDTEIGLNLPLRYNPKSITLMNTDRVLLCCAMDESAYFDTEDYPIIDDETIGQYTGIKDKNGTKIFENDILSAHPDELFPDDEIRLVVEWHDYGWFGKDSKGKYTSLESKWVSELFEVIGNRIDNPELLKGE